MNLTREEVLEAIEQIQYLYRLKHEIRYAAKRTPKDTTESVAEHIYGMHIVATYFLPLEDPTNTWNKERIFELITWHDIDEVETGDTVGFLKTAQQRSGENEAAERVVQKAPQHMRSHVLTLLNEYAKHDTPEARFVKAIDKIEPVFQLFNDTGKEVMRSLNTRKEDHINIREPYIRDFPYIKFFHEVTLDEFTKRDYFID